jgi:pimeloyl-ACP methyl ester carboxylesterase
MHSAALALMLPDGCDWPGLTLLADLHLPEGLPPGLPRALLVCLAGGGANRGYFNLGDTTDRRFSFAERMTGAGFAVAAIDIPGVGGSDTPPDFDRFSPRDAAAVLHAALAVLRHDTGLGLPAIGVGHSMGGMLIILQQAHHGDFAGIALLGSNASGLDWALTDAERGYAHDEAAVARDLPALVAARFGSAFDPMQVKPGAGAIFAGESQDATQWLRTARDRLFNAGAMQSMIPGSLASAAGALKCPLFLASGDKDIGAPPREAIAAFAQVSDAQLLVLPATGHNHFGFASIDLLCRHLSRWILKGLDDEIAA